jgi:glucose-1-phosphate adenylyltransferase
MAVLSLILGGGQGRRLLPLTQMRSKPAVPIAGKYRLIDIPISNCINSGLTRIYVLTQFLSVSLHRHIANTYRFDPFSKGYVELLAAQQTNENANWYQGTADAVRQSLRYVEDDESDLVLILSGDQLYRMDFRQLVRTHEEKQADVTIAVLPVNESQVAGFGIMRLDDSGRVIGFVEKPTLEEQRTPLRLAPEWLARQGIAGKGREYLASMGIYLFSKKVLVDLLKAPPPATDFGKELFPRSIKTHRVQAHLFDGYWEDVGTVKSYHEASLALAGDNPPFNFHSPEGVIYTRMRFLPASRISASMAHCLVSDGCVVEQGTRLERCVLGVRSQIGRDVTVRDTVIIGADRYESEAEKAANRQNGLPNFGVGDGTVIERAILDKGSRIGRHVRIVNQRGIKDLVAGNYAICDGIVVVPKDGVVPDGTVI